MELLTDGDIATAWTQAFPRRAESNAAVCVLLSLAAIIRYRSEARTTGETRAAAVERFHIPETEWNTLFHSVSDN